jgi:predicted dehydrogenase
MNRRDFLQASAVGAVAATAAGSVAAQAQQPRVYRAGVIGCGWYGNVNLRHLIIQGGNQVEVTALCDVDSNHLRTTADEVQKRTGRRPQTFSDFRTMLRPRNLDLVIVATPDHWHALTAIAAMEAGADVYVEKPISHTYLEGRAMVQAARRHNRVVQVGTQRRSTRHIIAAREFYRQANNLGRVGLIRAYCYVQMRGNDNPKDEPPPKHLDFEMWTGPAPMRGFNRLMHPRGWRRFNEYSNGILGDMGIHMLDVVRWFADLRYPRRVSSTGGIYVQREGRANITDTQTVSYDYPDKMVIWEHRTWSRPDEPPVDWGVNFYGQRGTLQVTLNHFEFRPTGRGKPTRTEAERDQVNDPAFERDVVAPAGRAHWRNFLECVRTRARPVADIEEGHISTSLCTLGNVSQQLGRSLTWDAERERFVNDEEANRLLRRDYRKPWVYPS